jgi:hypothetical protein
MVYQRGPPTIHSTSVWMIRTSTVVVPRQAQCIHRDDHGEDVSPSVTPSRVAGAVTTGMKPNAVTINGRRSTTGQHAVVFSDSTPRFAKCRPRTGSTARWSRSAIDLAEILRRDDTAAGRSECHQHRTNTSGMLVSGTAGQEVHEKTIRPIASIVGT